MIDSKLETLLKVCEMGSFTAAAENLNLTQPAVSHHIHQLEKEFGINIFSRSEKELRLTPEGELIMTYAKRITSMYRSMTLALKDAKNSINRLTVGVTRTAENSIVSEILARYGTDHDNLRITVVIDTLATISNKLLNNEIDIAIVEGRLPSQNFSSILLDTDSLVLAVSNSNPLAQKTSVSIADLKKQRLILRLPDSGTRELFELNLRAMNENIENFNIVMEVDSISTIKYLVQRDFGVSVLAKSVCIDDVNKGKLQILPISGLNMPREINIFYRNDFIHTEILRDIQNLYNRSASKKDL